MKAMKLARRHARKVLEVVDAGLSQGLGEPIPGQMCIEAAVCYALGLPHGDEPPCVAKAVREFKIILNDTNCWKTPEDRAAGLRRLAIAQLGSAGVVNNKTFNTRLRDLMAKLILGDAIREQVALGDVDNGESYLSIAKACDNLEDGWLKKVKAIRKNLRPFSQLSYAIESIGYAETCVDIITDSDQNAGHRLAEEVVQILIKLKSPGCKWLDLAPLPAKAKAKGRTSKKS